MAALSRVFRVTAGREWLSVSLLKGELAVSCKTGIRVGLCFPSPSTSTLVGWSNPCPTDVPRAWRRNIARRALWFLFYRRQD